MSRRAELGPVSPPPGALPLGRAGKLLVLLAGALLAACASEPVRGARFRTAGARFQIDTGPDDTGEGWRPFFIRGVDLSVGKPGTFPGELAAKRADYDRWLLEIAAMNANVVRLYTLHHPRFYEAFAAYNRAHPDRPLYLLQGIWMDELEQGDYMSDATEQIAEEIRIVVDAVHGCAEIGHRFGKAYGHFRTDVSPWLLGWLPGHEMDGRVVRKSLDRWASHTEYDGRYIARHGGLPIEAWVARNLDLVVTIEKSRYGHEHPVGWSNWPALDPLHHRTETKAFGQDLVDVNFAKFDINPGFSAGIFASYHVYPFNPEFIIYDPDYRKVRDRHGRLNAYLGYLRDLVRAHEEVPVLITEFGVPSSFGVAHVNEHAWNHGGYTERQQAAIVEQEYDAIVDAGAAGAVVFEWLNEWFKRTWMTTPTTLPAERGPRWWDALNPEESFGIKAFFPIPGESIRIDGDLSDWPAGAFTVYDAGPDASTGPGLRRLRLHADSAFLYLGLEARGLPLPPTAEAGAPVVLIGLSTVDGPSGSRRWPLGLHDDQGPVELAADHGLESVVVLDPAKGRYELLTEAGYDPTPRANGTAKTGGLPASNADGDFRLAAWLVNNDAQYIAAGADFEVKRRYFAPGLLQAGDSATLTTAHFLSGVHRDAAGAPIGEALELRIPWHALWVTDPSSRKVLFDDPKTPGLDARPTEGIRAMAALATRDGKTLRRLPGSTPTTDVPLYRWPVHDPPSSAGERFKPVYATLRARWAEALPEPKL